MRIDTSSFPIGENIDYESEEELAALHDLKQRARTFITSFRWTPPISDLLLAFGVAPIVALFLVRFGHDIQGQGDNELWLVVGDLPSAYFVTDRALTPSRALQTYCELMEDWSDEVLGGRDLSGSYPVEAPPTVAHAKMLKQRIAFIRRRLIPIAENAP